MEVRVGMDGTGADTSSLTQRAQRWAPRFKVVHDLDEKKKTNDCLTKMLLSLNNIAHHIKHSDSPHLANTSSYGALDLSNDEAQHPSQVG